MSDETVETLEEMPLDEANPELDGDDSIHGED